VTIFLLDPGLRNLRGHHMKMVVDVREALRARGQAVRVAGHRSLPAEQAEACGAEPVFSVGTYDVLSDDAMCWPLETMLAGGRVLSADLQAFTVQDGDVMVWLMPTPAQVLAAAAWMPRWPARVLSVFVGGLPFDRYDTLLWRFAWRRVPPRAITTVAATAEMMAQDYAHTLQCPVIVIPSTHDSPVRDRRGASPPVIGVVGHQRPSKGIHVLPEVVRRTRAPVRWLVHDSGGEVPDVLDALEAFPNVEVVRGPVADWDSLLARCDALFMPYERARYERMHSGPVYEALAGGMPMIFPNTPALMAQSEEGGRAVYAGDGPDVMAAAVDALVERFDRLAAAALQGAAAYRLRNGPGRWADWLIHHAETTLGPGAKAAP